jgi:hypothetical protein
MSETVTLPNVSNDAFIAFLIAWERQKSVCNRENALLANIAKQGRADGIPVQAVLDASRKMKALGNEAVPYVRDMIRVMALRNMPVSQPTLFDGWDLALTTATREEDSAWRAENAGFEAGLHGGDVSANPFAPGTEIHIRWEIGRRGGMAVRERNAGTGGKASTAPRQRPARQAKAKQLRVPGTEAKQDSPKLAAKKAAEAKAADEAAYAAATLRRLEEAQQQPPKPEPEPEPAPPPPAPEEPRPAAVEAASEEKRGKGRPPGSKNKTAQERRNERRRLARAKARKAKARQMRSTPRVVATPAAPA